MYGQPITFVVDYFQEDVIIDSGSGPERPKDSELERLIEFVSRELRERREATAAGTQRNGGVSLGD